MTQTITQLLLLVISGVAVFTIIVPTINSIGDIQKETDEYSTAIESAFATNERLNTLVRQSENLSQQERYRIDRFIPASIDPVKTAHDLEILVEKHKLFIVTLNVLEEIVLPDPVITSNAIYDIEDTRGQSQKQISYRDFELVTAGTYEQFKSLLADIESSAQLFEIQSVSFQSTNSDIVQYSMIVRTFGLTGSDQSGTQ